MPLRRIEPVEYYSNLEGSLDLPELEMGADFQLSPELTSPTTNVLPSKEVGGGGLKETGFLENFGNKLTGIVEAGRDYTMPAWNLAKGFAGFQDPTITDTMRQDLIERAEAKGGDTGTLGYGDFGLDSVGGRFTGGISELIKDPAAFANVGSVGRVSYDRDPETGEYFFGDTKYDFTPDPDTGSTGSALLDFINEGGIKNTFASLNFGSKAAAGERDDGWTFNYPGPPITGMGADRKNMHRPDIRKLMQMSRRRQQLQNFKNIEAKTAAEAAKKKVITTTPKGPPSITQKKTKPKVTGPTYGPHKKTKPKVTGPTYGPHGGGGSKKGSPPTGTKGKNPWGRADGGLINFYKYGGYLG